MFKTSSKPLQVASRRNQLGVSFFGLIFYAIVFGGLGLVVLKSFPIYSEYLKVNRIIKIVAQDNPKSLPEAAAIFERHSAIEDIASIRGTDLILESKSGKAVVSYKYTKKLPLIPPVSLVFDFEGSTQ